MFEILNFEEACRFLRVSKPSLYRYVRRGEIPAFKIGGKWKFNRKLLDNWMINQMHGLYHGQAQMSSIKLK